MGGSDLYKTPVIPHIILPSRNEIEGKDGMGVHVLPFIHNVNKLIGRLLSQCIMLDIPSHMSFVQYVSGWESRAYCLPTTKPENRYIY